MQMAAQTDPTPPVQAAQALLLHRVRLGSVALAPPVRQVREEPHPAAHPVVAEPVVPEEQVAQQPMNSAQPC